MPKFRESELKLGFPFFFVHCCRFSPKVADSRRKCHISATFFATQFPRRQVTRKDLIFFHLDDSDSFRRKKSEEPEISVSSRIFPITICGNMLVGGVFTVVLSFPHLTISTSGKVFHYEWDHSQNRREVWIASHEWRF